MRMRQHLRGLVVKAHILLYQSTLGSRAIMKRKKKMAPGGRADRTQPLPTAASTWTIESGERFAFIMQIRFLPRALEPNGKRVFNSLRDW